MKTELMELLRKEQLSLRDLDLDALALGILAHANNQPFHSNPFLENTIAGLCWRIGWNERALLKQEELVGYGQGEVKENKGIS
jgi:hypothetical protein